MIRVNKVNIDQYLPYPLHQDQLPSEEEAPQHPISVSYRHNREHVYHPIMNESNCEYTLTQEHVNKYIYDDVAYN